MKRLLRSLLLGAILSALLCVGVLAADTNDPGIYNIKTNDGVTITPKKADNSAASDAAHTTPTRSSLTLRQAA